MSTGFECEFIEPLPDTWYYVLQNWDCPVGADNWREYATAYGPFPTEDDAHEHLHDHHANPGGYTVLSFTEYSAYTNDVWSKLIEGARL